MGRNLHEARVIEIAATEMTFCRPLTHEDLQRVALAVERIGQARDKLAPAPRFRPEVRK